MCTCRCYACNGVLFIDAPVVACGRFNSNADTLFHPTCFACSECGELLVDLRAFVDSGKEERGIADAPKKLFCGRHWNDNRYPRYASTPHPRLVAVPYPMCDCGARPIAYVAFTLS